MRGVLGGNAGYRLLRRVGRRVVTHNPCGGRAYDGRSKLEALFGPGIWAEVVGKTVIDHGCGPGKEAVELAKHGARRVIGIDIRESELVGARRAAETQGVADRCVFVTRTDEKADLIVSIDAFEHYADPAAVLREMRGLLHDGGRVWVSFGPPWYHPLGGHPFSVFPWAHLVFAEGALIRWRSDFKSDGARRFCEIGGGLNQMTVRRFERLLAGSEFRVERFEAVPIRKLRLLHNYVTREFLTSSVRCVLAPRIDSSTLRPPSGRAAAGRRG